MSAVSKDKPEVESKKKYGITKYNQQYNEQDDRGAAGGKRDGTARSTMVG